MRDSPRVASLSLWKLALAVLASLSWAAPGELRAESSRDAGTAPILSSIETLESGSDIHAVTVYFLPVDDNVPEI